MAVNIANVVFPGEFNPKLDKWSEYKERLLCALEVAGVRDGDLGRARSLFLAQCGRETYSLIASLLVPGRPTTVGFSEILAVLDKFYEPRVHEILQAEIFHKRQQFPGESMQEYIAAIGVLGAKCNFKDLKRQLRDRLVLGVRGGGGGGGGGLLRQELLRTRDLSYETAVQLCLDEQASTSVSPSPDTTRIQQKQSPAAAATAIGEIKTAECEHCTRRHSDAKRYPFIKPKCFNCKRLGHIASSCDKRTNQAHRRDRRRRSQRVL